MKLRFILLLSAFFLNSCAGNSAKISTNNDPESITVQWIEWLDADQYKKLKEISHGNTLTYVLDMENFFESFKDLEDGNIPIEKTIIERINCADIIDNKTECTYCCKDKEEETFVLIKDNGQWKVTDIIVALEDIDEEALKQEKMLEEMLNGKLPTKSEEL